MSLSDIEKERIKQKIEWEGGLGEYIEYGVSTKLYLFFKDDFDCLYKKEGKRGYEKHLSILEKKIDNYLNQRTKYEVYSNDELNSVNYVLY
jgi:hypothetical protein